MNKIHHMKKTTFFTTVLILIIFLSIYIYFKFNPLDYIYEFGGLDTENIQFVDQYENQMVIVSITSTKVSDTFDDDVAYDCGVMITILNQKYQIVESTIVLNYKNKMHHGFDIKSLIVNHQLFLYANEVAYQSEKIYPSYMFIYDLDTNTYQHVELQYTVKQLFYQDEELYVVEEIKQENNYQIQLHTLNDQLEIESTYQIKVQSAYHVSDLIIQGKQVYFSYMDDYGYHTLKLIHLTDMTEETLLQNIDLQDMVQFQNEIYLMQHDQGTIIQKVGAEDIKTINQFEGFYDRFLITKDELILGEIGTINQNYLLKYAFVFNGKTRYLYRDGQTTVFKDLYELEHETLIVVEFSQFTIFNHFKAGQSALWLNHKLND